jgi:hypothetical protein
MFSLDNNQFGVTGPIVRECDDLVADRYVPDRASDCLDDAGKVTALSRGECRGPLLGEGAFPDRGLTRVDASRLHTDEHLSPSRHRAVDLDDPQDIYSAIFVKLHRTRHWLSPSHGFRHHSIKRPRGSRRSRTRIFPAAETVASIRAAGGIAEAFALDIADRAACARVADMVARRMRPVSVLVNNAGINQRTPFTGDPASVIKDWTDIMAVNLDGRHTRLPRDAARHQGPDHQYRVGPVVRAYAHAELGRLYHGQARRARRHPRAPPSSAKTACASTRSGPG